MEVLNTILSDMITDLQAIEFSGFTPKKVFENKVVLDEDKGWKAGNFPMLVINVGNLDESVAGSNNYKELIYHLDLQIIENTGNFETGITNIISYIAKIREVMENKSSYFAKHENLLKFTIIGESPVYPVPYTEYRDIAVYSILTIEVMLWYCPDL